MTAGDRPPLPPGADAAEPTAAGELGLAATAIPPRVDTGAATASAGEGGAAVEGDPAPPLAPRPPPDRLGRAVARARIAEQLFATRQQVTLGRYHLLEQLGAGGMGVVWGAFDPQLDRRVAIKLVAPHVPAARERILAEGQALAKLAHPNVVSVFDVGVVEDQIYIVMEWVRGKTLRAHCREPRSVRDLVAIYRAAGEGLAAAHRAGLVHRDFKPDNAMIGDDGRVRVLDFGLARGEVRPDRAGVTPGSSGELTRGAGTPRYMSPEQAQGDELTPAADQYAFCVALREAIEQRAGGDAPRPAEVPRWIEAILARGTSRQAAHRFPSMAALLHALARDPRRVWRRRIAAAGVIAAAGAAFSIGVYRGGQGSAAAHCGGAVDQIAQVWGPAAQARVASHLRGLGAYGAQEAARLTAELHAYGGAWAQAHRAACLAHDRGELTPQLYASDLACLTRARAALGAVIELLGAVPADRLPSAVVAAGALPDASRCLSDALAEGVDPPPAAIAAAVGEGANAVERARVLAVAGDPGAVTAAAAASARATELGYLPLVAAARLAHGLALSARYEHAPALEVLDDAVLQALEAGAAPVAVEAYARALFALGGSGARGDRGAAAPGAIPVVDAIARHAGPRGAFARALLYNNAGTLQLARGDREGARAWFLRARALREQGSAASAELASIWSNLALVTPEPAARAALFSRATDERARELGRDHPLTLDGEIAAAMFTASPRRAYELARDPCRRLRALHPHLPRQLVQCSFEVAWLAAELGERAEARGAAEAAAQIAGADEADRALAAALAALAAGRTAEAVTAARAVADGARGDAAPWIRLKAVNAELIGAQALAQAGRAREATAHLEAALALLESSPELSQGTHRQRRLARARALLAPLVAAADPARARALAEAAAAWYRDAGDAEALLAPLAELLAKLPPPATGSR
jgi:hypothetical protein